MYAFVNFMHFFLNLFQYIFPFSRNMHFIYNLWLTLLKFKNLYDILVNIYWQCLSILKPIVGFHSSSTAETDGVQKVGIWKDFVNNICSNSILDTRKGRAGCILNPLRGLSLVPCFSFSPFSPTSPNDSRIYFLLYKCFVLLDQVYFNAENYRWNLFFTYFTISHMLTLI